MTLLIGAIFQTFHFFVSLRGSQIEIVPEWIGWLLISEGIDWFYLSHETLKGRNQRLNPLFYILIGITGVRFLLGIFGFIGYTDSGWYAILNRFLILVPTGLGIYVWKQIINDFLLLESREKLTINAENLDKAYDIFLVLLIIAVILGITPLAASIIFKIVLILLLLAGVNFLSEVYWLCKGLQ